MIFNREPALLMAAVTGLISLAVGFGLDWTGEQTSLVMAAVAAFVGFVVRQKVTPVDPPL